MRVPEVCEVGSGLLGVIPSYRRFLEAQLHTSEGDVLDLLAIEGNRTSIPGPLCQTTAHSIETPLLLNLLARMEEREKNALDGSRCGVISFSGVPCPDRVGSRCCDRCDTRPGEGIRFGIRFLEVMQVILDEPTSVVRGIENVRL